MNLPLSAPRCALLLFACVSSMLACAQTPSVPTYADTLRGSLRPERTAFDVLHYAIDIELFPADKRIAGHVAISYRGVHSSDSIQLDLDQRLAIERVEQAGASLGFRRDAGAVFVALGAPTTVGSIDTVTVYYSGAPREAVNAPWDGGLTWEADTLGRPWIGVSCEGLGASIWWPNKDHLSDEPDSMSIAVTVPDPLIVVANGQSQGKVQLPGGRSRYFYAVTYPINNYNVTLYAGHYTTFSDTLGSANHDQPLLLTYSVLDYNEARARKHFEEVKPMLRCYEQLLGPYPFWRDGYRLVEAPYLGMEHQSAVAYGNDYMRGYQGGMIPDHMDWDYLIIHESGHEYFGNAVSVADHAEMWIHESFTTYLEALYVECMFGHEEYVGYLLGQKGYIANQSPIVGPLGVNFTDFTDSDNYFKGAWILHTFRSAVGNDEFLSFLKDWYQEHEQEIVSTQDWRDAVRARFGEEYDAMWQQYLYHAEIPVLHVRPGKSLGTSSAWFGGAVEGFSLPLKLGTLRLPITTQAHEWPVSLAEWSKLDTSGYLLEYDIAPLADGRGELDKPRVKD